MAQKLFPNALGKVMDTAKSAKSAVSPTSVKSTDGDVYETVELQPWRETSNVNSANNSALGNGTDIPGAYKMQPANQSDIAKQRKEWDLKHNKRNGTVAAESILNGADGDQQDQNTNKNGWNTLQDFMESDQWTGPKYASIPDWMFGATEDQYVNAVLNSNAFQDVIDEVTRENGYVSAELLRQRYKEMKQQNLDEMMGDPTNSSGNYKYGLAEIIGRDNDMLDQLSRYMAANMAYGDPNDPSNYFDTSNGYEVDDIADLFKSDLGGSVLKYMVDKDMRGSDFFKWIDEDFINNMASLDPSEFSIQPGDGYQKIADTGKTNNLISDNLYDKYTHAKYGTPLAGLPDTLNYLSDGAYYMRPKTQEA